MYQIRHKTSNQLLGDLIDIDDDTGIMNVKPYLYDTEQAALDYLENKLQEWVNRRMTCNSNMPWTYEDALTAGRKIIDEYVVETVSE